MIGNGGLIFRVDMRVPCIAEWARECERVDVFCLLGFVEKSERDE